MTRLTAARTRRAITLIEMLVVMALIAGLAAMAMVITPGVLERDRATAAVSQLEGACQITRARAQRDGLPRGVRLVLEPGKTESVAYQYIEYTPIFVPNPGATLADSPYTSGQPPYVEFRYTAGASGTGSTSARVCRIVGLHQDHWNLLSPQLTAGNTLLSLPLLGGWYTITGITGANPRTVSGVTVVDVTVSLLSYPDDQLGATLRWQTYHFGVYGAPRVLLGEPTMQLPQKTCVDLDLSEPRGSAGADYDILFAPSGQLLGGSGSATRGAGHVFLWIRDPTRTKPTVGDAATLQQAGEQLITVVKARSGAIGSAPVDWGADPFILAKKAISGQ